MRARWSRPTRSQQLVRARADRSKNPAYWRSTSGGRMPVGMPPVLQHQPDPASESRRWSATGSRPEHRGGSARTRSRGTPRGARSSTSCRRRSGRARRSPRCVRRERQAVDGDGVAVADDQVVDHDRRRPLRITSARAGLPCGRGLRRGRGHPAADATSGPPTGARRRGAPRWPSRRRRPVPRRIPYPQLTPTQLDAVRGRAARRHSAGRPPSAIVGIGDCPGASSVRPITADLVVVTPSMDDGADDLEPITQPEVVDHQGGPDLALRRRGRQSVAVGDQHVQQRRPCRRTDPPRTTPHSLYRSAVVDHGRVEDLVGHSELGQHVAAGPRSEPAPARTPHRKVCSNEP